MSEAGFLAYFLGDPKKPSLVDRRLMAMTLHTIVQ